MSRKRPRPTQQLVTTNQQQALQTQQIQQLYAQTSDLMQRIGLAAQLGQAFDGKRDYYETLGYKRVLSYDDFQNAYDRGDIAQRIVDAPVDETWKRFPEIEEDNDEQNYSDFELQWQALMDQLNLQQYFELVDRIAGIGQYALLLIGAADGKMLSEPLEHVSGPHDIKYLAVYSQRQAQIVKLDIEPTSPRFGKPESYLINLAAYQQTLMAGLLPSIDSIAVHHSRVIHVAEDTLGDGVIGMPRLQAVFNRLQDLEKTVGGSAEMFWLSAWMGVIFEQDKDSTLNDPTAMGDEVEKFMHGLQRFARVKGIKAYTLGSTIPQPAETVGVILDMISAATCIPKRILIGSERGQLSSTQDEGNWKEKIIKRESTFTWPTIIRPFVNRMIELGALPQPTAVVKPQWANRFELTPQEKADVNLKKAQTLKTYTVTPELVVPPEVFVEEFLDLPPEIVVQAQQAAANEPPLNENDPQAAAQFQMGKAA